MGQIHIGDLFSKKVTKRRPIWAKSLLWRLSILKGDPFGNTGLANRGRNSLWLSAKTVSIFIKADRSETARGEKSRFDFFI